MNQIGRRAVLGGALAAGVAVIDSRTAHAAPVRTDPFALGVAAGDPLPDGLVLWTRLVRDPYGSLPDRDVEVEYEISTDPRFATGVRRGRVPARARLAHSVHADVCGLTPGTEYAYRFRAESYVSPVGRARTAPAAGTAGALRFAIANCQDYQNGYWPAYSAMAAEDVDFVLHLGDYIYEYDPKSDFPDRKHTAPETSGLDQLRTLGDYRARHAQYKLDPALQAAHARAAWIATWDDHEVENNYAGSIDEIGDSGSKRQSDSEFRRQRAAGYQAYYEHMPIRVAYRPGSSALRLYRGFDFGSLLRLNVLDTRQYRTDQPGGIAQDFGTESAGAANRSGTLVGPEQESWLQERISGSGATWDVLAQQVIMGRIRFPLPIPGLPSTLPFPYLTNLDQWDGYAPARERLLRTVSARRNPVVLGGDIHSTWMNDLVIDPDDPDAKVVASEFVSTSVSSSFIDVVDESVKRTLPTMNPRTRYFDGSRRGYLLMDVTPERWQARARTVSSIATRTAPVTTTAAYVVEAGRPGIVPA
jgi:alkaline phosphatase D